MVVEVEEISQSQPRFPDSLYFLPIDVLILDRPPEPLYENVIQRPPAAVHADLDTLVQQRVGEAGGGELGTL